ncbi:helicase-related protein [Thioalkalivibrio sp. HK1]|uniref:helicase-related protein n=1 Tax=Thioalkalivibrio sp. HK1 TaxID=1469245 RepID=UPI0004719892|nr:helicase-related protein [Thioalkalivibrio sp. HK1]
MKLEDLKQGIVVRGILPDVLVTVIRVEWSGSDALELTYKLPEGKPDIRLLYREDEEILDVIKPDRFLNFEGDGALFRLVSEAMRIRHAHFFDPLLAIHSSNIDPLPHQITAVYESMLPRQPLRFLLADDPGAGKTIMAGLLIKELMARSDVKRCLVVCPGTLAEQWQDELINRFQLNFEIPTKEQLSSALFDNWFAKHNLVIARLDQFSRNDLLQERLKSPDFHWDLIVCDEAHRMSATYSGDEIKYTKRYQLGKLLSTLTRHFLLMTATPHNGKEEDFQAFMALLDGDRFQGRYRAEFHQTDVSDLMRRMVKEDLIKFDGTPLFPERIACTLPFKLSKKESLLYEKVTAYVREEFNRADALGKDKRVGTIGFALTILQRRLASSPEAIHRSLQRRCERLEDRLNEEIEKQNRSKYDYESTRYINDSQSDEKFINDWEDVSEIEHEGIEGEILDRATAARTIEDLQKEIEILKSLEKLARKVKDDGEDKKWLELANLIAEIFNKKILATNESSKSNNVRQDRKNINSNFLKQEKLVIFTEHRDTLNYLNLRINDLLGRPETTVVIHGGIKQEDRTKNQERFRHDPEVRILLATDAAGEGVNLQSAHLMVNYDLPWNPNRLEQRFGRIHRIGQTEVCYLWNLVAQGTREGDVYQRLLEKIDQIRKTLGKSGGKIFDVLGKLRFDGKSLRDFIIEAVRSDGDREDVQVRSHTAIDSELNSERLKNLIEEHALTSEMSDIQIQKIGQDMERAQAKKLQPYYIESFFYEAFRRLGGQIRPYESNRYEIKSIPISIRDYNESIGRGGSISSNYKYIVFERNLMPDDVSAEFICPGHSLLDAVVALTLDQNPDLLKRGAVLVDEGDIRKKSRILFYFGQEIRDATSNDKGGQRIASKRMFYIEMNEDRKFHRLEYAPYLDYRPLKTDNKSDSDPIPAMIIESEQCAWIFDSNIEKNARDYVIEKITPEHLKEIRKSTQSRVKKIRDAVKDRLTKEINYYNLEANQNDDSANTWISRTDHPKSKEFANMYRRLANHSRRKSEDLSKRMENRLCQLSLQERMVPSSPVVLGCALVISQGLLNELRGSVSGHDRLHSDTQTSAAKAREITMEVERGLGNSPVDRETEKLGYDIESRMPDGRLRLIEVKGRINGAPTITVTRNEILYSLNNPENYILSIVEFFENGDHNVHYLYNPFRKEADFDVTSVNYNIAKLLKRAQPPS